MESCDAKSTESRNEYLMALAAANAHQVRYFSTDLPGLMEVTLLCLAGFYRAENNFYLKKTTLFTLDTLFLLPLHLYARTVRDAIYVLIEK